VWAHGGALLTIGISAMLPTNNGDIRMSNKLEQVAVRLEPELRERLQAQADADMRPLASLIRKSFDPPSRDRETRGPAQHERHNDQNRSRRGG